MNKIRYEYNGVNYVLQYTRASTALMETALDFKVTKMEDMVVSSVQKLFHGAFIANHSEVSEELIDEMYGLFSDKKGLFVALSKMYAEVINSLYDEPEQGQKNITWEMAM